MRGVNFGRRPRGTGGAALPAWVPALPEGVWDQVGANTLQDVDPRYDEAVNPNYPNRAPWTYNASSVTNGFDARIVLTAWGGGAHDQDNHRFIFTGGGHDDYAGNEVYGVRMDLALPTFVRYSNPSGASLGDGELDDGQEATNAYADGRPRSIHSYGSLQIIGGKLYMAGTPAPFATSVTTWGSLWEFDIDNDVWTQIHQGSSGNDFFKTASATCYDSTRHRLYGWRNNSAKPHYYDLTAETLNIDNAVEPNMDATETWLIYIPELDIQVALNRLQDKQFCVYDYGVTPNGGLPSEPGATGDAPGESPTAATIGYSPVMWHNGVWVPGYGGGVGAILCWHGGRDLYVLTPPSSSPATNAWAWSKRTISTGDDPGAVNNRGLYGRFFYDSTYKVLGLVKEYNAAPYWLKLPEAWF